MRPMRAFWKPTRGTRQFGAERTARANLELKGSWKLAVDGGDSREGNYCCATSCTDVAPSIKHSNVLGSLEHRTLVRHSMRVFAAHGSRLKRLDDPCCQRRNSLS